MLLDAIDFSELYKQQMQLAANSNKTAEHWDNRAQEMANNFCANRKNPYLEKIVKLINFEGAQSLLDVGCGPGTVALHLASFFKDIIGIDYSMGMIKAAQQLAIKVNAPHAKFIQQSWESDWSKLPKVDISIASRSTLVPDLQDALLKLNNQTKLRVYTTHKVSPYFVAPEVLKAIGRTVSETPTYIYAINILNQMGIHPKLDYILDTEVRNFTSYEEYAPQILKMLSQVTAEEENKLKTYYDHTIKTGQTLQSFNFDWAMVWWDVIPHHQLSC